MVTPFPALFEVVNFSKKSSFSLLLQDAGARVVMYESQQWLPVASLFGLVGCPIPRELKAEVTEYFYSNINFYSSFSVFLFQVLLTLAAFARSPDIATSMIHTLESVQVHNMMM